jgi:glycosyltransferase involved in cell wall biosynthesis
MGKERGKGRGGEFIAFHRHITSRLPHVDIVFCHMNPIYAVLAAPYVRLYGKRQVFWYAHGHVSTLLKLAARFSDTVITSTPEGYRLNRPKAIIVGQGIDLEKFSPKRNERKDKLLRVISVGRISPVKNLSLIIEAMEILVKKNMGIHLTLVGGAGKMEQENYLQALQSKVDSGGLAKWISFAGPVPHSDIPNYYRQSDLFCTASDTGSLDKAILEAMACGVPVIGCNAAFAEIARSNGLVELIFEKKGGAEALAEAISRFYSLPRTKRQQLADKGKAIAAEHDLSRFTARIADIFKESLIPA